MHCHHFRLGIGDAEIDIIGRKHSVRSARDGDYWRLLVPGEYDVEVRKWGYFPTRKVVRVSDGQAANVDFFMQPVGQRMDESGTEFEVKQDDKKPVPVSLVVGLTVVCLIALVLALALAIMLAKKYRGVGDERTEYSAVHTNP